MMDGHPRGQADASSRTRRLIAGSLIGLASLAATAARAQTQTHGSASGPAPAAGANGMRTSLHQQIDFRAMAPRIYEALLNGRQFTAITGEPAKIDPAPGGAFSMFGGKVVGRNVELVPSLRIVQAWRSESWETGVYSIVRFEFRSHGPQTRVLLDQTGFPEGDYDSLYAGWKSHYWDPLERYLG